MLRHKAIVVTVLACLAVGSTAVAVTPRECARTVSDRVIACTDTLLTMRFIQVAIDAYGIDHKRYPAAASMRELKALLEPVYIGSMPFADAWGTELKYVASPDGASYVLVSAGSDMAFDEPSWSAPGLLASSAEDAVVSSGEDEREWVIQR